MILCCASAALSSGPDDHSPSIRRGSAPLPLPSPSWSDPGDPGDADPADRDVQESDSRTPGDRSPSLRSGAAMPLATILSSLAVVLGLFIALVWVSRKAQRGAAGQTIPEQALRVLGRKPLGGGASIALVRCGRSLLVLGITPAGMHSLARISDEAEARHLEALCAGQSGESFRETLDEMQREGAAPGFLGQQVSPPRKRLFS